MTFMCHKTERWSYNITRLALVRGISADWTPEDIKSNVTTPFGYGEILKNTRLVRFILMHQWQGNLHNLFCLPSKRIDIC